MPQKTVETLWRQDRASLRVCGARHKTAIGYYTERDRRIGGNK